MADTSAVGSIIIPAMEEDGYSADFSVGVTACSSVIGVIILNQYSVCLIWGCNGSIGKLFLGGMIPGILIGLSQMVISFFIAKKYNYGTVSRFSVKNLLKSFSTSFFILLMPIIILGGIILGIVTLTWGCNRCHYLCVYYWVFCL